MHTAFHTEIESISESIQNSSKRLDFVLKHAQNVQTQALIIGLEKMLGLAKPYVWVMHENDGLHLQITASLYDLRGMKDRKLTKVINHLMAQEFEPVRTKDYVSENLINRDFIFAKGEITVRIHAYVRDDSKSCKRVQIGEKVEIVPQYEIVCK